jgi:hypothetical protein
MPQATDFRVRWERKGNESVGSVHQPPLARLVRTTSQDDYLIRLIRQMVQMLLRIVGLKQAGQFEEALSEIDQATRTLLGPAADTLMLLDPSTAARVLADPDRVLMWATLLSEQAEIRRSQGNTQHADSARERSLELAREALRAGVSDRAAAEALIESVSQAG